MTSIDHQIQNAKPAIESVLASYHDCGPFDGGCLIFANALKIKHGGELVRICSNIGQGQTEHYGLLVAGVIYDADGGASSPEAWIERFKENESIQNRDIYFAIGEDANSDCVDDAKTSEVIRLLFDAYDLDTPEKTSPCASNVLADFTIQDWHVTEVGDGWTGPKEHRDTYRFVIEQSPSGNQIYFRIYPKIMDKLSEELELNGLSGCIAIRNGKPAISLGTNENDLPVHVESDIIEGLHIYCDSDSEPTREQFQSFDHGMTFDSHYYRCNDSSWLMKVRSDIANERFGHCNFGELFVVDHNGWEIDDTHWSKTVYFENPDGGDSIKGHYELRFANDSIVVLSETGFSN